MFLSESSYLFVHWREKEIKVRRHREKNKGTNIFCLSNIFSQRFSLPPLPLCPWDDASPSRTAVRGSKLPGRDQTAMVFSHTHTKRENIIFVSSERPCLFSLLSDFSSAPVIGRDPPKPLPSFPESRVESTRWTRYLDLGPYTRLVSRATC